MKGSEVRAKAKEGRVREGTSERGPIDISSPGLVFTDAASRDDLYALPRRQFSSESVLRPRTGGGQSDSAKMDNSWTTSDVSKLKNGSGQRQLQNGQQLLHDPRLEQLGIGMALGSPSHPPWMATHKRNDTPTSDISVLASTPSGSFSSSAYGSVSSAGLEEQNKRGKWKMFGGLFAKKGSSHPTTPASATQFYSLDPNTMTPPPVLTPPVVRPAFDPEARLYKDWTPDPTMAIAIDSAGKMSSGRQHPASKPLISRSHTTPYDSERKSPTPPPKDERPSGPGRAHTAVPLLQVDIPDVKMERYSVMFGNVLQPRSSLMVRRQQQLAQLKVIEDFPSEDTPAGQELMLPIRRATLPSPQKSPSYTLSLFPTVNPERRPSPLSSSARPIPSPLHRSNTAPSASPARATFAHTASRRENPEVVVTVDSPSPIADSPETPSAASWPSQVEHSSTDTADLASGEVSPREPEHVVITLEAPVQPNLKDSISMPHLRRIDKPATPVVPPQPLSASKSPKITLRSKYNTSPMPSPRPDRLASLNKPLPSPQAQIEAEERKAREARQTRNASVPLAVRKIDIKAPRKGSLPARPSPNPEQRQPRSSSLAIQSTVPKKHASASPLNTSTTPKQPRSVQLSDKPAAPASTSSAPVSGASTPASASKPFRPIHTNPLKSAPASAAEISIARQISISRRQQMMVPMVPKRVPGPQTATLVVPARDSSSSSGGGAAKDSKKAGEEKSTAEDEDQFDTEIEGQGKTRTGLRVVVSGHVKRKSEYGVVESI